MKNIFHVIKYSLKTWFKAKVSHGCSMSPNHLSTGGHLGSFHFFFFIIINNSGPKIFNHICVHKILKDNFIDYFWTKGYGFVKVLNNIKSAFHKDDNNLYFHLCCMIVPLIPPVHSFCLFVCFWRGFWPLPIIKVSLVTLNNNAFLEELNFTPHGNLQTTVAWMRMVMFVAYFFIWLVFTFM